MATSPMAAASRIRLDLYLKISSSLDRTELKSLRSYVSTRALLPRRQIVHAEAFEICEELQRLGKVEKGDLSHLSDALLHIGRIDLAEEVNITAAFENEASDYDSGIDDVTRIKRKRKSPSGSKFRGQSVSTSTSDKVLKTNGKRLRSRSRGKSTSSTKEREQSAGTSALPDEISWRPASRSGRRQSSFPLELKSPTDDVSHHFDLVSRKVGSTWSDLARKLGFDHNETDEIRDQYGDHRRRCLDVLNRWRDKKGTDATLKHLKTALKYIGGKDIADILEGRQKSVAVLPTHKVLAAGCTLVEEDLTIVFPPGSVAEDTFISIEIDRMPKDFPGSDNFAAVTPLLMITKSEFLKPVKITLPWCWHDDGGSEMAVLVCDKNKWSFLKTGIEETPDGVVLEISRFSRIMNLKRRRGRARNIINHVLPWWNSTSLEMVYIIIDPVKTTVNDNRVVLLCIHKQDDRVDYYKSDQPGRKELRMIRVRMEEGEKIFLKFSDDKDVVPKPGFIPECGIYFVNPNCDRGHNRCEIKVMKKPNVPTKDVYDGLIEFTRRDEEGEIIQDPDHCIYPVIFELHNSQPDELPLQRRMPGRIVLATKNDVSSHFDLVSREVREGWDDLARELGFDHNEIAEIQDLYRVLRRRCLEVLNRWRDKKGNAATLKRLKTALKKIDKKIVADML